MKRLYELTYAPDDEERSQGFLFVAENGEEEEKALELMKQKDLPLFEWLMPEDQYIIREVNLRDYDIILVPKGTPVMFMPPPFRDYLIQIKEDEEHIEEARTKIQAREKEIFAERDFYG